ncbi:unnamed protein product [Parascedosporium putredinis]|uniref:Uncharacterized protein n=1 Tax=Parascedosporium putredinis TaxID=1442378 RepID=A0A9P1MBA8_9PEZI|nr:unnamed protein product [Parascedosporium putredinis]CAI7995879.1 unnamed protein product [Parascedosporium putredinis]
MAHSGRTGRRFLWQNKGLDFYVSLLADQYWQVTALDAILVWLQEETANVESHLLNSEFTKTILSSFSTNKLNSFDSNLLEPLLKLVRLSPSIAASLAVPEMLAGISQRLGHKKPVVRLNLCVLSASSSMPSLMSTIQRLADKDSAVLVRNLASELVKLRVGLEPFPDVLAAPTVIPNSPVPSSRRPGSGNRRNNSYTPPGLHVSMSVPPTPSHANPRHRPSISTSGGAYIEGRSDRNSAKSQWRCLCGSERSLEWKRVQQWQLVDPGQKPFAADVFILLKI